MDDENIFYLLVFACDRGDVALCATLANCSLISPRIIAIFGTKRFIHCAENE